MLSAKAIVANATAKAIARMTFFIRRLRLESSIGATPMQRIVTGLKNGAPEKCGKSGRSRCVMLFRSRVADYADSESLKQRAALRAGCGDD